MVDLRQLQCFVVCADVGSFSQAAVILYTTQSSVSKMISFLEAEVGGKLFERHARGIALTGRGKYVYGEAQKILEASRKIEDYTTDDRARLLCVSFTPSSWLADVLTDFYLLHESEDWYYRLYSRETTAVLDQVRSLSTDIGFIQVSQAELDSLNYQCLHRGLVFSNLKFIRTVLFRGAGAAAPGNRSSATGESTCRVVEEERIAGEVGAAGEESAAGVKEGSAARSAGDETIRQAEDEMAKSDGAKSGGGVIRLIQRADDRYGMVQGGRKKERRSAENTRLQVVTDSDYVIDRMLSRTSLSNISGDYMNGEGKYSGTAVGEGKEGYSIFGYVVRKDDKLPDAAVVFLRYIKDRPEMRM